MREAVSRVAKQSGIYGLGVMLSKAVGFLMIPVYTRYLVPRDYGILELLDLIVFFAGIFSALGIYSAVFRFYSAYESERDKKEVIATALFGSLALSLLVTGLVILFAPTASLLLFGSRDFAPYVRVVALTLLCSNLTEVPLAYLRAREKVGLFVGIGLCRTVVSLSLLILLIAGLKMGVWGAIYANLTTGALFGVSLFTVTALQVPRRVVRDKLREMLVYGAPLAVQSVGSFVLVFSDRFFVRRYGSLTDVGLYALGYKLAGIVSILVSGPFNLAWQWQQFEFGKRKDAGQMYAKIQVYQSLLAVCLALAVAVLARDALRILSPPEYWSAARVVPLLAFTYVLADMRSVILSGLYIQRVTSSLIWISLVVAAVNLVLNYLLISRFLVMGAAVATILSYMVSVAICYLVVQRVFFVRYEYARNAFIFGVAGVIYGISTFIRLPLLPSILANLLLVLLFLLVALNILDRGERDMFKAMGTSVASQVRAMLMRSE